MISDKPEQMFGSPVGAERVSSDKRGTYDERLARILKAATGVIARVGYERASMRAVAKAAGTSLAGLYHYFDSKERMLFLIQFRSFNSLLINLREKLHGVDKPEEQLRVMIHAQIGYFAANMEALKVCSHELDSLSGQAYEETRRIRREYYELSRGIIDRVLEKHGRSKSIDRHVATMFLFGTLNWLYRWYNPSKGPSVNTIANQIYSQYVDGLVHIGGNQAPANSP